ncbi:MAG: hypothetical protein K0S32_2068 [Bacteroidetes bacterium]|jgi:hypothetical protein|nr:hypothetical protein [Bacteroidota bacterium]
MRDALKDFIDNNRDAFKEQPRAELWTRIDNNLKQHNIKSKNISTMIKYGFGASAIIGITLLAINLKRENEHVPQVNNKAVPNARIEIPISSQEHTTTILVSPAKKEKPVSVDKNSSPVEVAVQLQDTTPAISIQPIHTDTLNGAKIPVQDTLDITNWPSAGSDLKSYNISGDYGSGKTIGVIKSVKKKINGFISMMQSSVPEKYLGKRVRMTGYIRTENVAEWTGLWLRVGVKGGNEALAFDNMRYGKNDRSIKGTTPRTKYEIVVDVPSNSANIVYGIMLVGTGQIWFDSMLLEEVDESVPLTSGKEELNPARFKKDRFKSYHPNNFWKYYVPGRSISKDGTYNINIK